jgi:hypothetical protein
MRHDRLTDDEIDRCLAALALLQDIDLDHGHADEARKTAALIAKLEEMSDIVPRCVKDSD